MGGVTSEGNGGATASTALASSAVSSLGAAVSDAAAAGGSSSCAAARGKLAAIACSAESDGAGTIGVEGTTTAGIGASTCCVSVRCTESITPATLVERTAFVCVKSPPSPGLRTRTEIETLQNEQLTRSFQSQFKTKVLPEAGGRDSDCFGVCAPDEALVFGEELVSVILGV